MLEIKEGKECRRLVSNVFDKIEKTVVSTMGAKGLLVGLNDDFGKTTLTDDGVSVARAMIWMDGLEKGVATDMIEAAATTEKEALDGTTLTILLVAELYRCGINKIKHGYHPQVVADRIEKEIALVRELLVEQKRTLQSSQVKAVATIATKIPAVGEIVDRAHQLAGDNMNIIIEHSRDGEGVLVEQESGYSMDSGYMTDALSPEGGVWMADNAKIVLMKEGMQTTTGLQHFFESIPKEEARKPWVFVLKPNFNPNTLRLLIDTLGKNKMMFEFIFVNESHPDDVFLDLSAVSGATVQDAATGVGEIEYQHVGEVKHIEITQDKTRIEFNKDNTKLDERIAKYKDRLDKKWKISEVEKVLITRRLSSLENGIVKIKVGVPTITEFNTLKLKLDDAIGAVRMAIESGVVLGAGKALRNVQTALPRSVWTRKVLALPSMQILENAGIKKKISNNPEESIDVMNGGDNVNLWDAGILDSYKSIDQALKNASSIACSYLRTNTLIKKS